MSEQVEWAIEVKGNWPNALVWYYVSHTNEATTESSALDSAATWSSPTGAQWVCDELAKKTTTRTFKVIEIPCQY